MEDRVCNGCGYVGYCKCNNAKSLDQMERDINEAFGCPGDEVIVHDDGSVSGKCRSKKDKALYAAKVLAFAIAEIKPPNATTTCKTWGPVLRALDEFGRRLAEIEDMPA